MGTTAHLARWWHSQEDGIICCNLCPRHCHIANENFGYCQVRFAKDGKLFTLTYGHSSGFAVDPVEKKPLFHFLPGTSTFSFGSQSCNLECAFCQNWRITQRKWDETLTTEAAPEAIAAAAKENLCPSVSFTYNEPIISLEHVVDTAKYCHQLGIRTIAVTNGFISKEARESFFSVIDAANVDLKGFQEKFYQNYCKASLKPVLDTLEFIANRTQTWLEVTTLLIPGANDSTAEVNDLTKWISNHLGSHVPLHLSAFHPDNKLTHIAHTPAATLLRARDIAKANGLHHVYTGNIADITSQTTYCAECGHVLIEREGFHTPKNHLNEGKCPHCEVPLAGIFIRQNSRS